MEPYAERTHVKMQEVLMSPEASGPRVHYHMIRGGTAKTNITVWESGTIDTEYIKSYGHYHVGDLEETYTVIQGEGIIILQSPLEDENSLTSFRAIRVKTGDTVHIPRSTGHLAVNIGKTWFVTSDDSPVNFTDADPAGLPGHADYEPFKKMRGAGYYIIEKDGQPALVKNPLYGNIPSAIIETL